MIDLFQLQIDTGKVWPQVQQALQEARQTAETERDAAIKKCESILVVLKDEKSSKEDALGEADKTEKARKIEELTARMKESEDSAATLKAEIDALNAEKAEKAAKQP